jgi:hypothetical protein
MRHKSATPRVPKLVHISPEQNYALEEIQKHFRTTHSEVIREGIDAMIEHYAFIMKDCGGIILEKEIAKRLA